MVESFESALSMTNCAWAVPGEYTAPEKWLSPQQLEERMRENGFVLDAAAPEAVVIRDHARKFQFVVSHGMLFRKS